jgi:uncharacterized protein
VNETYDTLVARVDALAARFSARYAKHLVCRAGCSGCCHHHLSVFAVEAAAIRRAIEAMPAALRGRVEAQARETDVREARGEPVACPLLVDDRCAIYESRPLICRTQGLPLLLEADDGELEVDFCPLNFSAPDAANDLEETHLVPLERINLQLALVNLQFCRDRRLPEGARHPISAIIANARADDVEPPRDIPISITT